MVVIASTATSMFTILGAASIHGVYLCRSGVCLSTVQEEAVTLASCVLEPHHGKTTWVCLKIGDPKSIGLWPNPIKAEGKAT